MSDYSVIIPHRKEGELLKRTVEAVMATSQPRRIIANEDEPPQGVSLRRHQGIGMAAEAEFVLIVDAHMAFPPGWADRMCDVLRDHPKGFLCVECRGLEEKTWAPGRVSGYGAEFRENEPTKEGRARPCMVKWHRQRWSTDAVAECPVPLGACYGMRRDWYLEGLGGVWQHHRGWGRSEQMLALMNWICGGENLVLQDVWAAHLFRTVAHVQTQDFVNIQNVLLIAWAMMDDEAADRILGMTGYPGDVLGRLATRMTKRRAVESVKDHIARHGVRTYREFLERWGGAAGVQTAPLAVAATEEEERRAA